MSENSRVWRILGGYLALGLILGVLVADTAEYFAGFYPQAWRGWAVALALEFGTAALVSRLSGETGTGARFFGWATVLCLTTAGLTGAGYRLAAPALEVAQAEARAQDYQRALERAVEGQGSGSRYFLAAGQKTNAAKASLARIEAENRLIDHLGQRTQANSPRIKDPLEIALLWLNRLGLQLAALWLAWSLGRRAPLRLVDRSLTQPQAPLVRPGESSQDGQGLWVRDERGRFKPKSSVLVLGLFALATLGAKPVAAQSPQTKTEQRLEAIPLGCATRFCGFKVEGKKLTILPKGILLPDFPGHCLAEDLLYLLSNEFLNKQVGAEPGKLKKIFLTEIDPEEDFFNRLFKNTIKVRRARIWVNGQDLSELLAANKLAVNESIAEGLPADNPWCVQNN